MITKTQFEALVAIDQGYPGETDPAVESDLKAHGLINEIGELTKKGKVELFECDWEMPKRY